MTVDQATMVGSSSTSMESQAGMIQSKFLKQAVDGSSSSADEDAASDVIPARQQLSSWIQQSVSSIKNLGAGLNKEEDEDLKAMWLQQRKSRQAADTSQSELLKESILLMGGNHQEAEDLNALHVENREVNQAQLIRGAMEGSTNWQSRMSHLISTTLGEDVGMNGSTKVNKDQWIKQQQQRRQQQASKESSSQGQLLKESMILSGGNPQEYSDEEGLNAKYLENREAASQGHLIRGSLQEARQSNSSSASSSWQSRVSQLFALEDRNNDNHNKKMSSKQGANLSDLYRQSKQAKAATERIRKSLQQQQQEEGAR